MSIDMKSIQDFNDLKNSLKSTKQAYLLLYKSGSEQSDCALENVSKIVMDNTDTLLLTADVKNVRDIHGQYGIKSVPVLLKFSGGEFVSTIKGCQPPDYYSSLFANNLHVSVTSKDEKPQKRVVVYTTPTCPHCTSVKQHLKVNGIRFRDVDVSRDQNAAEQMTRKSGQRGVPQIDIDGQIIVGFNKPKINELLGIN
jgi:glutaredoxin-like YruB-family protein